MPSSQGIYLTQGSNPHVLHRQVFSYHWITRVNTREHSYLPWGPHEIARKKATSSEALAPWLARARGCLLALHVCVFTWRGVCLCWAWTGCREWRWSCRMLAGGGAHSGQSLTGLLCSHCVPHLFSRRSMKPLIFHFQVFCNPGE